MVYNISYTKRKELSTANSKYDKNIFQEYMGNTFLDSRRLKKCVTRKRPFQILIFVSSFRHENPSIIVPFLLNSLNFYAYKQNQHELSPWVIND